jgi:protein involved in polysaccharide export with SLBB domain
MLLAARLTRLVAGPLLALLASGCIGARIVYPVLPDEAELAEFEAAGPVEALAHAAELASMRVAGPYRVVPGDLLAIELPPEVTLADGAGAPGAPGSLAVTLSCRVRASGTVVLPMLGEREVAGRTTGEIEALLAEAYHAPERLRAAPNVVVTVAEHQTVTVAVLGAVVTPGLHELRSDHRTVIGALMAAGGIDGARGAREIRIVTQASDGTTETRTLGVHLADVPLADLPLAGGETLVVEPAPERAFTVYGLVKRSGIFDYPLPRRFNLMQALATAGGVDEAAAPRFATIYRVKPDGTVVGATFKIDGTSLQDGSNVWIKDGDVIAVEHTQGSWLRMFFSNVFGFRASVNLSSTGSPTL